MAERTGLEPAASNVTGWRSNQLSYRSPFTRAGENLGELFVFAISKLKKSIFGNSAPFLDHRFQSCEILDAHQLGFFVDFPHQTGKHPAGTEFDETPMPLGTQ